MRARLVDKRGNPVPESEYDLELGEDNFVFKLKKPDRSKSGRYRVVLSNDAGDAEKEVDVDLSGKEGRNTGTNTHNQGLAKSSSLWIFLVVVQLIQRPTRTKISCTTI